MKNMIHNKHMVLQHEKSLAVLPLKNVVILPHSIRPIIVGRDMSIRAVNHALYDSSKEIFVTTQKNVDVENPGKDDLYAWGVCARILQVARMPNGSLKMLIEGVERARVIEFQDEDDFMKVTVEQVRAHELDPSVQKALRRNLVTLFREYIGHKERVSSDTLDVVTIPDLDHLADAIGVQLSLDVSVRQKLLETVDLKERVIKIGGLLKNEIEVLEAENVIRDQVQRQVEKNYKDHYLHEQMRAIQRELGKEDQSQEIEKIRSKAKKNKLSPEALEKVKTESSRLEQMQTASPEAAVCRNYLDWLCSIPWYRQTTDSVSMKKAQEILDATHAGMKKIKDRIIEFLAVKKYAKSKLKRAPIICLVGPPGVGKTSLAESVAKSLGRKLVRISLGGLRDEAEIRGHRRTYIGAMPGKIIQAMKRAKVINPVILLDEIDKMSMDFRGDPASALLEVLDPEQNKGFVDNFLEVEYDLSKIMFITTANAMDGIPYALLDRMEVIQLSGYTEREKHIIASKHLLPRLLKEHALKTSAVTLEKDVLQTVIEEYTKEAGVRQLERVLAKIIRKSIQAFLSDKTLKKIAVTKKKIVEWLGVAKHRKPNPVAEEQLGLATGLAWTELGGDLLDIEVTVMTGKGGLSLTGQLGEVMQESAQAALSFIRSRSELFGLKEDFYTNCDIHIHIPEGAIPKDGPSAGITIAAALISALTKVPLKKNIAMTGEVTLRGRVLPVGGLKEKLLAAARFGMKTVVVPHENAPEIKEFESEIEPPLEILYVKSMDDLVEHVFGVHPKLPKPVSRKRVGKTVTGAKRASRAKKS